MSALTKEQRDNFLKAIKEADALVVTAVETAYNTFLEATKAQLDAISPPDGGAATAAYKELSDFYNNVSAYLGTMQNIVSRHAAPKNV